MLPILSQQPNAIDARNTSNSDHIRYVLEIYVVIGFEVGDPLHADGENITQPIAQVIPIDRFFIHHHLWVLYLRLFTM